MSGIAKEKFVQKMGNAPWKEKNIRNPWPYLSLLEQEGTLDPADLHFARYVSKGTESEAAFLIFLLQKARDGHTGTRLEELGKMMPAKFKALAEEGARSLPEGLVCFDGELYSFPIYAEAQKLIYTHIDRLKSGQPHIQEITGPQKGLTEEQQKALNHIAQRTISFICGGPGTGKSYLAASLINCVKEKTIAVAAPTGKAAANLRERLGSLKQNLTVSTLHALVRPEATFPLAPRLNADLVIVDEGSMIDARLFAYLLASIKTGAKCVFFGDPFQLPPILPGSFFADFAKKEGFFLKECHRTDLKEIIQLAECIKQGDAATLFSLLEKDTAHISLKPLPPRKELLHSLAESLTKDVDFYRLFSKKRILTPLRKGAFGVEELARDLSYLLASEMPKPILITANDSRLQLYNGDIGVIDKEVVHFSDGRTLPLTSLPYYEPAYFLSVHKSQGSEYDEVDILLPEGSEVFGKAMLYTAVTRAKKKVNLFGTKEIIEKILKS